MPFGGSRKPPCRRKARKRLWHCAASRMLSAVCCSADTGSSLRNTWVSQAISAVAVGVRPATSTLQLPLRCPLRLPQPSTRPSSPYTLSSASSRASGVMALCSASRSSAMSASMPSPRRGSTTISVTPLSSPPSASSAVRPTTTSSSLAASHSTQCAAVRTQVAAISTPPQYWRSLAGLGAAADLRSNATIQGCAPGSAS